MKTVLCVFGTRPEAIKMAPVVRELKKYPALFRTRVVVTAQHRDMLDQVLRLFKIRPDADLNLMRPGQSLTDVTVDALRLLEEVYRRERPDMVLVQGDTTTVLAASLAAYYQGIPVGHVEAGLRSDDVRNPFPEEVNRRLADAVSTLHFAPTEAGRRNLLREGLPKAGIHVTGNTGIDALHLGVKELGRRSSPMSAPFILLTAHRRENFGAPLENVFQAVADVARARPALQVVYPVHPNPQVRGAAGRLLKGLPNVRLLPPLDYGDLLLYLKHCLFVVTDSGGLQEESPSLGKPVLVLRRVTERPEGVKAGVARLVGTDRAVVRRNIERLLDDRALYRRMSRAMNPYGDGRASSQIVQALKQWFRHANVFK
jgi:UDP-N-acetylglucosamine 2-epimerase (non-hydrolysing)